MSNPHVRQGHLDLVGEGTPCCEFLPFRALCSGGVFHNATEVWAGRRAHENHNHGARRIKGLEDLCHCCRIILQEISAMLCIWKVSLQHFKTFRVNFPGQVQSHPSCELTKDQSRWPNALKAREQNDLLRQPLENVSLIFGLLPNPLWVIRRVGWPGLPLCLTPVLSLAFTWCLPVIGPGVTGPRWLVICLVGVGLLEGSIISVASTAPLLGGSLVWWSSGGLTRLVVAFALSFGGLWASGRCSGSLLWRSWVSWHAFREEVIVPHQFWGHLIKSAARAKLHGQFPAHSKPKGAKLFCLLRSTPCQPNQPVEEGLDCLLRSHGGEDVSPANGLEPIDHCQDAAWLPRLIWGGHQRLTREVQLGRSLLLLAQWVRLSSWQKRSKWDKLAKLNWGELFWNFQLMYNSSKHRLCPKQLIHGKDPITTSQLLALVGRDHSRPLARSQGLGHLRFARGAASCTCCWGHRRRGHWGCHLLGPVLPGHLPHMQENRFGYRLLILWQTQDGGVILGPSIEQRLDQHSFKFALGLRQKGQSGRRLNAAERHVFHQDWASRCISGNVLDGWRRHSVNHVRKIASCLNLSQLLREPKVSCAVNDCKNGPGYLYAWTLTQLESSSKWKTHKTTAPKQPVRRPA